MGFLDDLKKFISSETAELKDIGSEVGDKLDADITKREREMKMTPEEKMEAISQESKDDSSLDAVRDKIENKSAHAQAEAELDAEQNATDEDLEAEEE